MRYDDERHFPPGVVPGAVGAVGALAAIVLVCGLLFGALLALCDRREPVQMIPTTAPVAQAIASSSAQVVATQSVRVTIRRPSGYNGQDKAPQASPSGTLKPGGYSIGHLADSGRDDLADSDEIVIEVSQAIAATSCAGASASESPHAPQIPTSSEHGRLGVIAATMPGILAADLQLLRFDVSPATRWLVGVPLEVGLDVAGNLEAGAVGASIGGKAYVIVGAWSRWNLSAQGVAGGIGVRF